MATPLSPLEPRGAVLGDEVYRTLGEAILDGSLAPGERLRDQELAEWLGVSRTPVREAIQRLTRIGLVEVAPNRFTRVTVPDPRSAADTDEFMGYVLADCVRITLTRADDDAVATAVEMATCLRDASARDDRLALYEASTDLFTHIVKSTGNTTFLTVFLVGEFALRRDLAAWNPAVEAVEERTELYSRLVHALAARDGDAAEQAIHCIHGFS